MRWLEGIRDESGVSALLMALLIVPLLGMAALVVDVGLMYFEVRQLQNGADAAAVAIATDCADGLTCSDAAAASTAAALVDQNSNDGVSQAEVEFGTAGANTVTVRASTDDAVGSNRLAFLLAPILGFDTGSFARSATAIWGSAALEQELPLTISECEWNTATNEGSTLPSPPTEILIKGNPGANECLDPTNPGMYQPGGYGWLDPIPGQSECIAEIDWFGVPGDTGNIPPNNCKHNEYEWSELIGEVVTIPVHNNSQGQGDGTTFDMIGLAAFRITSLQVGGQGQYKFGPEECSGTGENQRCLIGYFESISDIGASVDPDAPDLGVQAVELIG